MSILFAYMAGGKGVRGFKMFCQRRSDFFLLALCVCMCVCVWGGGGGGVRFSTSPSVKKITDPLLLINDGMTGSYNKKSQGSLRRLSFCQK